MKLPYEFSRKPLSGERVRMNLPCELGEELGKEIARMTEPHLAMVREKFPDAPAPCSECAFVAGTVPNGCLETVADALKCVVEGEPFYCHKGLIDGEPRRICAGYMAAITRLEDETVRARIAE